MSIRCDWFVLCRRALQDADGLNLTLVDCVDQLEVPVFPWAIPGFAFAAYFSRDAFADNAETEFRLVRSDQEASDAVIYRSEGTWAPGVGRMRVWANFVILRAQTPGKIDFRLDWRTPDRRWKKGPTQALTLVEMNLSDEDRAQLLRSAGR